MTDEDRFQLATELLALLDRFTAEFADVCARYGCDGKTILAECEVYMLRELLQREAHRRLVS